MAIPQGLHLDIEDEPTDADLQVLYRNLEQFNEDHWPQHQPWRPLGLFVRGPDGIVAGLAGESYGGWLFIRYLWVSEWLRGQGLGGKLMREAERLALERGCHSVWLDTYSFQAPEFYLRLGYEVFSEVDWSPDHKRIFLRKRLQPGTDRPGDSSSGNG